MKRFLIVTFIFLVFLKEALAFLPDVKPEISDIKANASSVPLFEKFELTFHAQGNWDNPFDPEQIAIDCIVYPPKGDSYSMPAFYYQDYHRIQSVKGENLEPIGTSCWKVRLTPVEPGTYRYKLKMKNGKNLIESAEYSFTSTSNSNKRGFVRISKTNPRYFEYENGEPYFIIGENMTFFSEGEIPLLEKWMTSLTRAGGNHVRTWWCRGLIDLESAISNHPDQGLGRIRLDAAWNADYQVDLSEKLGVAIMTCLETQQYLRRDRWWKQFTYNEANGGPVKTPEEYFINEDASRHFKNRLRYIIGRWSYSTSIFSWQLWNEVNACDKFNTKQGAEWHREMAHYIRMTDPYSHIIHTNNGYLDGQQDIDSLPEMEVISTNNYSHRDMAHNAVWSTLFMTSRYQKPYILTEYGVDDLPLNDPKGIMFHNGLWGAALAGAAGGGLPWYWDNWVDAQNLYPYFEVFSKTFLDVPFNQHKWNPVEVERFVFRDNKKKPYYAHVFFEGWLRNYLFEVCPDPMPDVFRITPGGEVVNEECFSAVLDRGGKQTLKIEMPVSGKLIIYVHSLQGDPILSVSVNGKEVLHKSLQSDKPELTRATGGIEPITVDLKAGNLEVLITNAQVSSGSSMSVAYELTDYRLLEGPNLDCVGLQSTEHIFIWLRNPDFTWMYDRIGRTPIQQPEGMLTLKNVSEGAYSMVWLNTITGEEISRNSVSTSKGNLKVPTPSIIQSAVAHLVRMK